MSKMIPCSILFVIIISVIFPFASAGDFSFNISSPDETIEPRELIEVSGTHQLTPSMLDKILPELWMSQYSFIEITDKPEWIEVSLPDSEPITPPNGVIHQIKMFLSLNENAPMNTKGTIDLTITTGRFMRTIFPSWFPLCDEYTIEKSISIQTGQWLGTSQNHNELDNSHIDDNEMQEQKRVDSSKPEELSVCFILVIIISIFIILVTVFFITQKYP